MKNTAEAFIIQYVFYQYQLYLNVWELYRLSTFTKSIALRFSSILLMLLTVLDTKSYLWNQSFERIDVKKSS